MDNLLNKKRIVFIIVIILLVIVTGLYSSYAINVFYNEGTPLTYDQALDFSLSNELEQEVLVEANKTKVIDFDITNPYEGNIKYGLTYEMINPTELPDGVVIAQSSESPNISVGMLEEDDSIIVSIIIVNDTENNLTLSLGLVYGYENGGELILDDGEVLIEEVYYLTPPPPPSYSKIDESGANAPGYIENLVPVMHNGETWVTADITSSTSTYGWYDYDEKKWANAVLLTETKRNSLTKQGNFYTPGQTIGDSEAEGVLAFYVWIPRYKYKVWNKDKIIG